MSNPAPKPKDMLAGVIASLAGMQRQQLMRLAEDIGVSYDTLMRIATQAERGLYDPGYSIVRKLSNHFDGRVYPQ